MSVPEHVSVLRDLLADPRASFSVGAMGAVAEFHRHRSEAVWMAPAPRLEVLTALGGLRIEGLRSDRAPDVLPVPFDLPSTRPGRGQRGLALCTASPDAHVTRSTGLSERGPDTGAICPDHRAHVLFDLGLGLPNAAFCVRTGDRRLQRELRQYAGAGVLDPATGLSDLLLAHAPHRVVISALARAEVFQAIGKVRTPEGPHTHLLPDLVGSDGPHLGALTVPPGFHPALLCYAPCL